MYEEEFSAAISVEEELAGEAPEPGPDSPISSSLASRMYSMSPFKKKNRNGEGDVGLFTGTNSSTYVEEKRQIHNISNAVIGREYCSTEISDKLEPRKNIYDDISPIVVSIGSDGEDGFSEDGESFHDEHCW